MNSTQNATSKEKGGAAMPKAGDQDIEALKAKALENATWPLTLLDLQGKRLWANKAFVELSGMPLEELLGVQIELAYPPQERERIRTLIQETIEKGKVTDFQTWFERDGKRASIKIHTALIRDEWGNPSAIVYSADNITQINQAHKEENQPLSSYYESIVELSANGIIAATPDGRIRRANKAAQEMLGLSHQGLGSVFDWVRQEDQEEHRTWIMNILQRGHGTCPGHDTVLMARDGRALNVFLHHELSRFSEDNTPCVIFYIQDLTEYKS
jgi:PAS domain S-box-containing protein